MSILKAQNETTCVPEPGVHGAFMGRHAEQKQQMIGHMGEALRKSKL